MGLFKKAFKPIVSVMAPGAGLLLNRKDAQNRQIDSQMINPGAPPGMLNPNQMPGQPTGLSAYGQLMQQGNAMDAMRAGEQAQAGAMGDLSQARSQLASSGGLSGGASERLSGMAMGNMNQARQANAYNLMRSNLGAAAQDYGNQMDWAQKAMLQNQQMQGQIYAGNQMANATMNANRPKGLFGLGFMGL